MSNLQEYTNLFFYNIFRFECFTQSLVSYPINLLFRAIGFYKVAGKRTGKENFEEYLMSVLNDPRGGISLHLAGIQVTAHLTVLLVTPWNIISGLLLLDIRTSWFYGFLVIALLAVVISFYVAPDYTKIYLKDFKRFEKLPKKKKLMSALLTFLIVVGSWSLFVGSSAFYLRALIHSKPSKLVQETNSVSQETPRAITPEQQDERKRSTTQQNIQGDMIWRGESGGYKIWWTTSDLHFESPTGIQRIWETLVKKGVEDFIAVNSDDGSGEPLPAMNCEYDRTFVVMSIVGTLVSFKDSYYVGCEREAHPSIETRFTTIELAKSGEVLYALEQDIPMMEVDLANPGNVVKLTDYFTEEEILRALLADRVVRKALDTVNAATHPKTLAELVEYFEKNNYELGESGYELRPDFLTRFAFHHIKSNRVAVRIGLPPHYGANRALHKQLGLLLPVPAKLRTQLELASQRRQGFLMRDSNTIAGGRVTIIRFETGNGIKRIQ